jgi:molybdate transport system permease protein
VIGSLIYSLPFAVQPLRNAFIAIGDEPLEAAATWAPRLERFWRVALPLALPGYAVAALLVFAHTVGEFGVVMMLGGGIPGPDRGAVDRDLSPGRGLEWGKAHRLSLLLLAFAFVVLFWGPRLLGPISERPRAPRPAPGRLGPRVTRAV